MFKLKREAVICLCIILFEGLFTEAAPKRRPLQRTADPLLRWLRDVPHLPRQGAWDGALREHALPQSGTSSKGAVGTVILTQGNVVEMETTLPKMMRSLSRSPDTDLTQHTIISALGFEAWSKCEQLNLEQSYGAHCALEVHWPGQHDPSKPVDFWHSAARLTKLELILNIITMGYSILWLDPGLIVSRNPVPYLAPLDVDMAFPTQSCRAVKGDAEVFVSGAPINASTSLAWVNPTQRSVRFVYDWLHMLHTRLRLKALQNDPHPDQTLLQHLLARHAEGDDMLSIHLAQLPQNRFPSWCAGECGCEGQTSVPAIELTLPSQGGVEPGKLTCPERANPREWRVVHSACSDKPDGHESSLARMDTYQAYVQGPSVNNVDVAGLKKRAATAKVGLKGTGGSSGHGSKTMEALLAIMAAEAHNQSASDL